MSKVIVVGGGAAGMMAAIFAARNGNDVSIYEKNEKLGKKLFITGKGRCNITNAADMDILFDSVMSNRKFLYSAFYSFTNQDVIEFFEQLGCKTKVERGNRVFPVSDKSSDVIGAMKRELNRLGVAIQLNCQVERIVVENGKAEGIYIKGKKEKICCDKLIIATGGLSYPTTGSTGDGYRFAEAIGHTITELSPSLVPFEIKEPYVKELQGLSLRNVNLTVKAGVKEIYHEFGEMLFTHYGVSGPVVLSASPYVVPYIGKKELTIAVDLKPALTEEQLDARILRDFEQVKNKQYKNSLDQLLPRKMIPVIISLSGIDPEKKVNFITKEERKKLVSQMKHFEFHVKGIRDYKEAIITKGGIKVKEIDPGTMESKKASGVYFVGEVLDLDALTGGFNLQIAWSTAFLAGNAV